MFLTLTLKGLLPFVGKPFIPWAASLFCGFLGTRVAGHSFQRPSLYGSLVDVFAGFSPP